MTTQTDPKTNQLTQLFQATLDELKAEGTLPADFYPPINLVRPKDTAHGDFACNIALMSAKKAGKNPRELAERFLVRLNASDLVEKCDVAGAGFINVFLNLDVKFAVLDEIFTKGEKFGLSCIHSGKKVQVEFVSANPTSSLHVGHGRGAAYGMSVANLLEATGYDVCREYYVNDAGRQMDILATSTYLRYLQACGEAITFPVNAYQGDYVVDFGKVLFDKYGDKYRHAISDVIKDVPADAVFEIQDGEKVQVSGDKELHIDGLIANTKALLGDAGYEIFLEFALNHILDDIKEDLAEFGVTFECWYSERTLKDKINDALAVLDANGYLYEKDGNIWFKSTAFGDEKDRVVKRANGLLTYFASDIAYHKDKFDRGFDTVINVWGADHHGYIPRVKAALSAMGIDPKRLEVMLVQFVALYRGDEKVAMSSRSGQFITLRELREEVGNDAARFYYVARTPNVHMDFDLELAKSQSRDNAVYYIQYAHARICRVFERLEKFGVTFDDQMAKNAQHLLALESENELIKRLSAYCETIVKAANAREPHILANYLKDLASDFHAWYNDNRILPKGLSDNAATAEEITLMQARLRLSLAVKQVLANGLGLLGLSAPDAM
ncbi:arginine--tRNA ligase [Moraxella nasovis]|uniref:arginine--tRNA ligase n=1 Tax=Moraxella nasovis TaxID=2904121 RepID=UPI001F61B22B|nr:arginine--tRNA ligase [Moraxella nasovis]UNU72849.1 arginine--tRNA ligase [Moraxella nasovis]